MTSSGRFTRTCLALTLAAAALFGTAGCSRPAPPPIVRNAAPLPGAFAAALERFHPEGTPGWSFTQTTVSEDKTLVERHDAGQLEFKRWSLVSKDGHAPTAEDLKSYQEGISQRTINATPPNVKDQIQRDTWEQVKSDAGTTAIRFRLKAGNEEDKSADFMAVTFFMHDASGVIHRVELGSLQAFIPMFSVQIYEAKTVIQYDLPRGELPVLLKDIHVSIRGKAMGFKSLDKDMKVSYSDYAPPPKRTDLPGAPAATPTPAR